MAQEPVIKSYYSLDENNIKEDKSPTVKEESGKEEISKGEFSAEDEKAFTVGLITLITIFVICVIIISWWLIKHNQGEEAVLGEVTNDYEQIQGQTNEIIQQDTQSSAESNIQPEEAPNKTYTVESGDTLYSIGKKFKIDYKDIMEINGIENTQILKPGQKIKIP